MIPSDLDLKTIDNCPNLSSDAMYRSSELSRRRLPMSKFAGNSSVADTEPIRSRNVCEEVTAPAVGVEETLNRPMAPRKAKGGY